jgi:hypothetical protein
MIHVSRKKAARAFRMFVFKFVFEAALPPQKHPEPSMATRGKRATIQALLRGLAPSSNETHSILLPRPDNAGEAPYPFLPFSSQNQSTCFDFGRKKEGAERSFRHAWQKRSAASFF